MRGWMKVQKMAHERETGSQWVHLRDPLTAKQRVPLMIKILIKISMQFDNVEK